MFADGGLRVSGNACIQICYQKICLWKNCTRYSQICICNFKLHVQVLGLSCQGWRLCSIRGRYWKCRQKSYASYPEHSGNLQVHSPSTIENYNWKVIFWNQTGWIIMQNFSTRRSITTRSKNPNYPQKNEIPQTEKGSPALSGVREILQKKYNPRMAGKLIPFYRFSKVGDPLNITLDLKKKPLNQ